MANAPFCNVKGVTVPADPSANALRPVPKATDLASALAAIRALTDNFNTLYNQVKPPLPDNPPGGTNFIAKKGKDDQKQSTWAEDPRRRVVQKVRVTNPDDPAQYVDVEQINSYTMQNRKTGELFTWKR